MRERRREFSYSASLADDWRQAEMRLALPALPIRLSRSLSAPKSSRFHPTPQSFGGHFESVFFS
jgi:hypothetical protein